MVRLWCDSRFGELQRRMPVFVLGTYRRDWLEERSKRLDCGKIKVSWLLSGEASEG